MILSFIINEFVVISLCVIHFKDKQFNARFSYQKLQNISIYDFDNSGERYLDLIYKKSCLIIQTAQNSVNNFSEKTAI